MHGPDSPEATFIRAVLALYLLVMVIKVWIWVDMPIPDSLFIFIFWAPFWILPGIFTMNMLSNSCVGEYYEAESSLGFYSMVALMGLTTFVVLVATVAHLAVI
ncbi:hypothetical protein ACFL35_19740 [Candidatus Riflebacteria bacterium]